VLVFSSKDQESESGLRLRLRRSRGTAA